MHDFKILKNRAQFNVCDHSFKLLFIEARSIQEPIASVPAKVWKSKSIKDIIDGKYFVDFLIDVIGVVDNVNKKPQTKNIVFDLKDFRTKYHEEEAGTMALSKSVMLISLFIKLLVKSIFEIITIEIQA